MIRGLLLLILALFPFVGLLAQNEGGCRNEISSELEDGLDGRVEELVCVEEKVIVAEPITRCLIREVYFDFGSGAHDAYFTTEEVQRTGYRSINELVSLATGYR